uniref:Uncharacterized protein n=1 Tax=Tanacetum cinerariifolium TaxID=118510 RepID=A0A699IU80_TANCI|nr:hypothetical protein [Tanacetum cinerariifolium]
MPAEASGPAESPSLDAELALTDSETESDDEVHKINTGDQDEGQARPNPGIQDEGQAGPNPGVQDEDQARSNPGDAEEEPGKTNTEAEVQSMVSVPIHQDTSSIPSMTTPVIDLTTSGGSSLEEKKETRHTKNSFWVATAITTTSTSSSRCIWCSRSIQQQSSKAQSSSKSVASTSYSMAWTISDTTYELAGVSRTQDLSLMDSSIQDDSIPDEQIHLFDDEDFGNDHLQKANSNVENNWATALASTYVTPAENSLLTKIRDMTNFLNERDQVSLDVNRPLPLGGPPGYVTIQTQLFFNKDLEYLRYGSKGSSLALSISKMKAASYPEFGLELLVPEKMLIEDVCTYDISAKYGISHWWFNRKKFYIDKHDSSSRRKEVKSHMQILSVVRNKAYSSYGYDYLSEIVLRRADLQEHTIAEKDFKKLHPSDFEDLNLLLLQGYEFKHDYTIIESPRTVVFSVNNNKRKIMRFNEIYKFNDGTLTWILEALAYIVKEFKATEDEKGLSEPGMICWWTSS